MIQVLTFNIVFLVLILITQIFWRAGLVGFKRRLLPLAVLGIATISLVLSYLQFATWKMALPTKYFLPPYQSINYFLFYIFTRFWASYVISLVIALLVLYACKWLNRRYNERFFYPDEPYLIATLIFLAGHPLWLFYLVSVLLVYCLYILTWRIFTLQNVRVSFYYFWIPVGVTFLGALTILAKTSWFLMLKI